MIQLPKFCSKGHVMILETDDVRESDNSPVSEIKCWILYGVCERCKEIIVLALHNEKIHPTEGIDYVIVEERADVVKRSPRRNY